MQFCQFLGCENFTYKAYFRLSDGEEDEVLLTERKSVLRCFISPGEILVVDGSRLETLIRGCITTHPSRKIRNNSSTSPKLLPYGNNGVILSRSVAEAENLTCIRASKRPERDPSTLSGSQDDKVATWVNS